MMAKLSLLLLAIAIVVSGCDSKQNQTFELSGTVDERVAGVSRVIKLHAQLPSAIIDARFIEIQRGDNQLGPADYRSFIWIKVAPGDAAKWRSILKTASGSSLSYSSPPSQPTWWLTPNTYNELTKFDSHPLFKRRGWIVIQDDGNIYAETYTM